MAAVGAEMSFKYGFCRGGSRVPFSGGKGRIDSAGIHFKHGQVAFEDVVNTESRGTRLSLELKLGAGLPEKIAKRVEGGVLVLDVTRPKAAAVEVAIDKHASKLEAEANRQRLQAEGRGDEFRCFACPRCDATVDCSELERSPYVYCRFCHLLFKDGQKPEHIDHRACDECGMFARNRAYTEFYFYFLLVIYGFRYTERHFCDACAGKTFWKVLLINSVFVLGVPSAIWMKVKSMMGRSRELQALSKANAHALAGRPELANPVYEEMLRYMPEHPGILRNQAMGYLLAGQGEEAAACLELSLSSCSNYAPSVDLVHSLSNPAEPEGEQVAV